MFKTEVDSPANHPELNYKVPILDMCVWVEKMWLTAPGMDANNIHTACPAEGPCLPIGIHNEDTVSQGMEDEATPARRMVPQILFRFYSKPMKPQRTCLASSANPWQQKRTMLTQECIRRLRNTSRNLCCKKKQDILSEYMQILKNSGYTVKFRKEILMAGLSGYNKILEADRLGQKPI